MRIIPYRALYRASYCAFLLAFVCCLWSPLASAQDLQVTALTSSSAAPAFGTAITLSVTVTNRGVSASIASVVGVYISINAIITSSDRLLGTSNVPALAANGSLTTTLQVVVPADFGVGVRWIGAIADYQNAVTETNESNNTKNLQIAVQAGTAPDLTPAALTLSKTSVGLGEDIDVNFTITNTGSADAPASTVSIRHSSNTFISTQDISLQEVSIPAIKAGSSYQGVATVAVSTSFASNYIGVFVDPTANVPGLISETNEGNNTRSVEVMIFSPDLLIDALLVSPSNFVAGDVVTATISIRNQGNVASKASTLSLFVSLNALQDASARLINQTNVPVIAAGATFTATVSISVTAAILQGFSGPFYVIAVADALQTNTETNENNNSRSTRVNADGIDLVPTAISLSNSLVVPGSQVALTLTIRNNGNRDSTASLASIHYSMDATIATSDAQIGTVNIPVLSAGTQQSLTTTVTIPTNATPGLRYIGVYADSSRSNTETNEFNNSRGAPLTVASFNLTTTAISVAPANASLGQSVDITYTIKNTGTADVSALTAGVYWSTNGTISTSDALLLVLNIPAIAGGQEYKATSSVTLPTNNARVQPGPGFLGVYVDHTNNVRETDESFADNGSGAAFAIVVQPLPDLFVPNLSTSTVIARPGDAVILSLTTRNAGNAAAAASSTHVYFSTSLALPGTLLHKVATPSLASGTSANLSAPIVIPANAAGGNAYLHIVADGEQVVAESNEANNTSSVKITIQSTVDPDKDGDGIPASLDCNDNDKTIYPQAPELCDGKDNDCNLKIDDGAICPPGEVCDSQAKACVKISPEPSREVPSVDAGNPCPGGCPNGQICINRNCISLPDAGEDNPEEAIAEDGPIIHEGRESLAESAGWEPGAEPIAHSDTAGHNITSDALAERLSQADAAEQARGDRQVTGDNLANAEISAGDTDPRTAGGCGCHSTQLPGHSLFVLFVFFLMIARKQRQT